jgi:putative Ca2+/H+ antiporter (TMEM165/GDT1 family)
VDAFLTSLFDRPQILCAALAMRYGRIAPIIWGLALATLCNCLISAIAGAAVHRWISEDALQLFYALSLIFAGIGMVAWRRPVNLLEKWRLGPFWTAFLGLFILQFGDKGQFVLMATAARTDMWAFAATGGWAGVMLACVPAILFRQQLAENIPMQPVRYAGGAAFLLVGTIVALGAWGIF